MDVIVLLEPEALRGRNGPLTVVDGCPAKVDAIAFPLLFGENGSCHRKFSRRGSDLDTHVAGARLMDNAKDRHAPQYAGSRRNAVSENF
jgi:hypothetical protein